ncbi:unnamed protein product [marine sediment metagenome]|uniref:CHAT domain-containing protein n=1 Tax=marine sediment metagenome TaxID=412755 RepID=X1RCJ9_9ZZZZ
MKAILCRPKFDEPTQHSFAFAGEILQWCRQAGIDIIELAEDDVVRLAVENSLQTFNPDIFVFYDHGSEDCLWGQGGTEAAIDLKNCDRLAGKEVFTLACFSAKDLGPAVWRQGGTYWGYVDAFSFTTDSLAEFQEAANCGFKFRFIEGDTRENSLKRAKETFTRLAFELVDVGNPFAAICMRGDGDALVYLDAHKPEEKEGCLLAFLKLPIRVFR